MILFNMIKPTIYIRFSTLALLIFSNTVCGEEISSFNLQVSHSETERTYESTIIKTQISSITAYRAEKISERMAGSLILGYQEQVQDQNTIVAARFAAGYFAGISVNYDVLKTTNFRSNLFTKYQYHKLDGDEADQKIEISWYDISFGIGNYYNVTSNTQLLADASVIKISGTQRALEPLSQIIKFENKSNVTYGVGIAYHLNASGYIAVKWLAGYDQGFRLFLAKDF